MAEIPDRVNVTIDADTAPLQDALRELSGLSQSFGAQLTGALRSAVVGGKDLDDILRRIGLNLAGMALSQGLRPLQQLTGSLFSGLVGGLMPASGGAAAPFAANGAISAPSYFPTAEAAMPSSPAALGGPIAGTSAGSQPALTGHGAVSVVFNVTTPDAATFRKSEAQITGMLARAVSRGGRTL